jgi:para-aminobenzoate synthetase component I
MWSDRISREKLSELVEQLRAVELSSEPPLATISYRNRVAAIISATSRITIEAPAFDILEAALTAWSGSNARLSGYLGYDLAAELEDLGPLPPDDLNMPEMYFGLYEHAADATAAKARPGLVKGGAFSSRPDRVAFEASVKHIVETIYAGDIFQTNLCRRIERRLESGSAWDLFQRMREINPARHEAFIQIDAERAVLSISPESFLRVTDRVVESSPIKGTRARGKDAASDEALAKELRASQKDRAELAMIVDVVRNDLGRVCEIGSVKVVAHAEMMTLPTVHHLYSTVTGKLRDDASSVDLLRAAFPPASISGAPKIEAIRVAMREEKQLRGPCMGAIGWISMNGDMDLSVAIRTAFVTNGLVRYYAGCGITADSVPSDEFEESEHKAAAFVRALR